LNLNIHDEILMKSGKANAILIKIRKRGKLLRVN
jgi:hypothetical protein